MLLLGGDEESSGWLSGDLTGGATGHALAPLCPALMVKCRGAAAAVKQMW